VNHRFQFFRAGGVDQVRLRDHKDLLALKDLDQKLWVALAMPTTGIDIDPETLALLDADHDGRIRVPDILAAIEWARGAFKDLDQLLVRADEVKLTAIKDAAIVAAAKRMLADLGRPHHPTISVADAVAIGKAFADTVHNGDGVVIAASTDDAKLRRVIEDVIATTGAVTDRSGKPGTDAAHAERFFAAVDQRAAWLARGAEPGCSPLGAGTAAAAEALAAVAAKLEDYFVRCRVAAFDPRAAGPLAGTEAELAGLGARALTDDDPELARLPLARIDPAGRLPLGAINPAWAERMAAFVAAAVTPILGARDALDADGLATITTRLAPYTSWSADRPTTVVDGLDPAWVGELAKPELRAALAKVIDTDRALAGEYDQISAVAKTVRLQRDFGRILRNFVNFADFYSEQDGVFQTGTLYLDARALHLCVPVADADKHGALAAGSDACLVYCDLARHGTRRQIVAALTNGDTDHVVVGRNGIFYDRAGDDWDATVVKVISNPVGVRQAFWSPYKKLVRAIEDNVQKRAQAAEADATTRLERAGAVVAYADKTQAPKPAPAGDAAGPRKIDLGTVAAIGVAIGGIGTLFGLVMSNLFGLGAWLPLGVIGLLLMISGPSMLLAWLKLRRRNLGPILDANGWAINNRARINVAFGAAMTELASLPKGAKRSLRDPFADRTPPWRLYLFTALVVGLAGGWYFGKLDRYLPAAARSTTILGENAPAYQAPPPAPAPPATGTTPASP
jgi:hypothetical protein